MCFNYLFTYFIFFCTYVLFTHTLVIIEFILYVSLVIHKCEMNANFKLSENSVTKRYLKNGFLCKCSTQFFLKYFGNTNMAFVDGSKENSKSVTSDETIKSSENVKLK